jgi:hypothetical protein
LQVKYVGKSFGIESLTDGQIYECLGVEEGMLRVIDDSGEDYLYSAIQPGDLKDKELFGKWEIIKDDENETLKKALSE